MEKVVDLWDFLGVESDRICSTSNLYEKTDKTLGRKCSSCIQQYKVKIFNTRTVGLETIYLSPADLKTVGRKDEEQKLGFQLPSASARAEQSSQPR